MLGCPRANIWPDVEGLPLVARGSVNLKQMALQYVYNTVSETFPHLSNTGIELIQALLTYEPKLRISAREALRHEYFQTRPYPQDPDMMPTFPTQHDR